ncbi:hypothetical protein PAESOLCIP111_06264 [Paenibacillus solanacearum]|uniref:Methyltransferase type 11 domain-containing protein n=1 Tax=Paenibacillus solanacearum TaxID=2048548 RepID=A0A916KA30_9BACL|nr:class I SAM-dependent methyltransferase [Paenibacillus solanacearum]CAG7651187.1 hypothetical protein PAESOLCIP111_06264 [Paenibacillus solanacearum]
MKVDLGCGSQKHPGFYGIDRHSWEGVDLVWDIDNGIPLPDQSVDWVMACRILPYVRDLQAVLAEIYRISIHKSIVCILAPYAHSFKHMANPLLRHRFDEHTPRHVTNHFYQPPHGSKSPDISHYANPDKLPYDFRLIRMEFFYNDTYRSSLYQADELDELRQAQVNVVDEIMYHWVVVKNEITIPELDQLSRQSHAEPLCVQDLRLTEPVDEMRDAEPFELDDPDLDPSSLMPNESKHRDKKDSHGHKKRKK